MIDASPLALAAPSRTRDHDRAVVRHTERSSYSSRAAVMMFAAVMAGAVICGWLVRDRLPLTPKSGVGYGFGIAGGATLLMLASYSALKRLRFLRCLGPLSRWFRLHMVLGVLAPVLILFHCNFHLGAPNSNVALLSMLTVAASGVIGRYIYTRSSHGLYGARATLGELRAQLDASAYNLSDRLPPDSHAARDLAAFAGRVHAPHPTIGGRLFVFAVPLVALWVRRRVMRELPAKSDALPTTAMPIARARHADDHATRELVSAYLTALVKEAQFRTYERLFALWHAFHIPLFIMLLLAGVLHVVAVHMY